MEHIPGSDPEIKNIFKNSNQKNEKDDPEIDPYVLSLIQGNFQDIY